MMKLASAILGTVDAMRDALPIAAKANEIAIRGAALIGAGEVDITVLARAPMWQALDLSALNVRALVLAEPLPDGATARAILERAAAARMLVFLVENGGVRRLRLDDLLGSPAHAYDWSRIRSVIEGKRVLITGGGGSIGGEVARRIASLGPKRLTLLDSSEYNLYKIGLELPDAVLALADIRDPNSMRRWFGAELPHVVFHTAALKQVPLVEKFPCEGVLTNVHGLENVAQAAHGVGADLIFVSTDKAVDPSGAMGASKRLGEMLCQALDRRGPRRAIPVRLGNVLGSTGSVSPIFEAQVEAGEPLTITDGAMTRYFLTIPQAADALLQAAAVGLASEQRGAVLVIEMGEALPVVDLARQVIQLAGKRPDIDVPIIFTGLRPGERLHESLIASNEWRDADPAQGVNAVASTPRGLAELKAIVERLTLLAREGADEAVRQELFATVAEAPAEKAASAARA
jgi:O-antigen biosynthesis protein WbqV